MILITDDASPKKYAETVKAKRKELAKALKGLDEFFIMKVVSISQEDPDTKWIGKLIMEAPK